MSLRLRLQVLVSLAVLAIALPGCRRSAPPAAVPSPALTQVSLVAEKAPDADEAVESALRLLPGAGLEVKSSGVGLVVCDPVASSPELRDFGRGCSRWLHLFAAGSPELTTTPLLFSLQRIRRQLAQEDLALSADEGRRMARLLGVNRFVSARLEGSPAAVQLTYELRKMPDGHPVGEPVRLTGTREQVLEQLPAAARALRKSLQVSGSGIPVAVGLDPEQISDAGARWWKSGSVDASADPESSPLLLVAGASGSGKKLSDQVKALVEAAPENPLVYGAIGYGAARHLRPHAARLLQLRRRFPKSYGLAHAEVWLRREQGDFPAEEKAARQVVLNAGTNPDAWLALAYTQGHIADETRKGRYAADISGKEWSALERRYTLWLKGAAQVVRLNRDHVYGWWRVATAATFAGEEELADAALWAALKLDPDEVEVYHWGLQMYQDKWLAQPDKLRKVAQMLADRNWPATMDVTPSITALEQAGLKDVAGQLASRAAERCRLALKSDPNSARLHFCLAASLEKQGDGMAARREWEEGLRLDPDNAWGHYRLGSTLATANLHGKAAREYEETLRLDPDHKMAHFDLAWEYKVMGKTREAEREFQRAIARDPKLGAAYFGLGLLAQEQGQKAKAVTHYQSVLRVQPTHPKAWRNIAPLLAELGRYPEAIEAATKAVELNPEEPAILNNLAYALALAGRPKESAEVCREILKRNPDDPIARVNLGEALLKTGKKAEAKVELQKARASGEPQVVAEAERLLKLAR